MIGGGMGRMIGIMVGFMLGIEGLRMILYVRGVNPISMLVGFMFLACTLYTIYVWTEE